MSNARFLFPLAALVGQEDMKTGLVLNVINPRLSGVLIRGEKGTAKSTAVRALADILPLQRMVANCPFRREPGDSAAVCEYCPRLECREQVLAGKEVPIEERKMPVCELPVGATEDRVVGTLDIEHALREGGKRFEPGILASAHRGFIYIDEVNLLDDHLVDILLDAAAMGRNIVEREGISFSHPARFVLVGTMNPEEGEIRPQLLDRFGLCVHVTGAQDIEDRVAIMERIAAFEADPAAFAACYADDSARLAGRVAAARELLPQVSASHEMMREIAALCLEVGVDGHRADIIMLKAAKTLCALEGKTAVTPDEVHRAANYVLPHRVRRLPMQEVAAGLDLARKATR